MTTFVALGSGGAWPDGARNAPAHLVINDDGSSVLVDCGSGTTGALVRAGVQPKDLQAIVLTHIHIDHCVDLAAVVFGAFLTGRAEPLHVFGPPGVEDLTSALFGNAYPFAPGMLKALRGVELDVRPVELPERDVHDIGGGYRLEPRLVKHGIATFGYRLGVGRHVVAFSGDTEPCEALLEIASGADLLVQDCAWPDDNGPRPGHCIPAQIGPIAAEAQPTAVLLHHMFPPCAGHEEAMVASVKSRFSGAVIMAEDLARLDI